jgi:hypothetical protein
LEDENLRIRWCFGLAIHLVADDLGVVVVARIGSTHGTICQCLWWSKPYSSRRRGKSISYRNVLFQVGGEMNKNPKIYIQFTSKVDRKTTREVTVSQVKSMMIYQSTALSVGQKDKRWLLLVLM